MTNTTKEFYTDYNTAVHWCNNNFVLCNNIPEIDESIYDNMQFEWYDEENDTYKEIMQWFITDCTQDDIEYLTRTFDDLLFTYSDKLDCYILCVDHWGTLWSGVPCLVKNEHWIKINKDKEYKD